MSSLALRLCSAASRGFHTSAALHEVRMMTRLRVVDNSELGKLAMAEGKPPRIICVYNKQREYYVTVISTASLCYTSTFFVPSYKIIITALNKQPTNEYYNANNICLL